MSFTRKETPTAYVYEAVLPGLKKEDVKVELLEGGILHISVQGTTEKLVTTARGHSVSSSSVKFAEQFTLPANAKVDDFERKTENGVLTVTVPKKGVKKPKAQMKAIQDQVRGHNRHKPGVGMNLSGTSSSSYTHPQVSGEDYVTLEDVTKMMKQSEEDKEILRKQADDAWQQLSSVESLLEQFMNRCNCQPSVPIPRDNYDSQLDPYPKHMLYNNKMNPGSSHIPSDDQYDTSDDGDDQDDGNYQHDGDYQSGSGYEYRHV